ncbi:hypothetical protein J6590_020486 [Homalodisca vitripennis]|nr:hypothetical protein J6590_020486 [Homalodisca vitripennis]
MSNARGYVQHQELYRSYWMARTEPEQEQDAVGKVKACSKGRESEIGYVTRLDGCFTTGLAVEPLMAVGIGRPTGPRRL